MVDRITHEREWELVRAVLEELRRSGGHASFGQLLTSVQKTLSLSDHERTLNNSGKPRWVTRVGYAAIPLTQAGYIERRQGEWHLTAKGEKLLGIGGRDLLQLAYEQSQKSPYQDVKAVSESALLPSPLYVEAPSVDCVLKISCMAESKLLLHELVDFLQGIHQVYTALLKGTSPHLDEQTKMPRLDLALMRVHFGSPLELSVIIPAAPVALLAICEIIKLITNLRNESLYRQKLQDDCDLARLTLLNKLKENSPDRGSTLLDVAANEMQARLEQKASGPLLSNTLDKLGKLTIVIKEAAIEVVEKMRM